VVKAFLEAVPEPVRVNPVAHDRFAPPGYGYVDGCATQLISPAHYREFFAPLDGEILRLHRLGGMIHLCGACTQHIPVWRAMKELASVQINDRAAEDFPAYFAGLRADQVIYICPTRSMPIAKILGISGGRRVVIQQTLEKPIPLEGT
jgi:hypothetical protein